MFASALVIFLLLAGTGSGQNTTLISLDQAIDLVLAHNHSIKATRTLILQNQAQEITANLRPNPTLGVLSAPVSRIKTGNQRVARLCNFRPPLRVLGNSTTVTYRRRKLTL
jgi:hypothetical protein